jgi:type II secretory pathway pseudopilin PulG
MNARHRLDSNPRQRGWSLIEMAMVLMLTGVMSTGLWKVLEGVQKKEEVTTSRGLLLRAEDALYGMALRDLRLPTPVDFEKTRESGDLMVLRGRLPEEVLLTEPTHTISYAVEARWVQAPGPIYRSDPMGLLTNPSDGSSLLAPRGAANLLDLCLAIAQVDQASTANVFDFNEGFSLARPLGDASVNGERRAVGLRDMLHRLGCIPAFARVTTEVKSATVFNDLHTVARINADLKGLELQATRDFLRSHAWRRDVVITNMTVSSLKMAAGIISFQTTPPAALFGVPVLATHSIAMTLWGQLLELSVAAVRSNSEALPKVQESHELARVYADQLLAQRDRHVQRANFFQSNPGR